MGIREPGSLNTFSRSKALLGRVPHIVFHTQRNILFIRMPIHPTLTRLGGLSSCYIKMTMNVLEVWFAAQDVGSATFKIQFGLTSTRDFTIYSFK